ncbi:MAG: TldD/PmbA family protein [Methanothrix sp.]|nr:TldD/PmbA family protein [Methanothrix sp.]
MRISDTSCSLLSHARRLVVLAEREGASEAEAFGTLGRSVDIDLRRDAVELGSESFHCGLGVRAVVKGAVGFSSTSNMARLEDVARTAVRSARVRGGDDAWRSLPLPESVRMVEGIRDPSLERIGPEECLEMASSLLQGCAEVRGVRPVSGGVACAAGTSIVVNSHGIELQESSTLMHASMEAIAKEIDVATGSEFLNSRSLQRSLEGVGRAAAQMAKRSTGGTVAESGTFDVLLAPLAFAELLEHTLIPSVSSENVQKGRSALAGRVGEPIASEELWVTDDGLLPGGMDSSGFDDEGVPSQRTVLIEAGLLRGYLFNSYTAGKAGVRSTGNAVRSGYADLPRVGIRNLIVESPQAHDLYSETRGYLVHGLIGAHTANPISGDFSVEARNAFYVAEGDVVQPIRSLMLAGNIFEALREISVGTDVRMVGGIVTPTVRVRLRVIGS